MLEKSDLQQIGLLLDEKLEPLTQRLNNIEVEINDIKLVVGRIDKRTDEDTSASFEEIEKLKKRISTIEEQLRILKAQNA